MRIFSKIMALIAVMLFSMAPTPVKADTAGSPEEVRCLFRACVHDGGDAVLIFAVDNETDGKITCRLGKPSFEGMQVVGSNGRVFTDLDCYVNSRKVTGSSQNIPFEIESSDKQLVSMVIHNVPADMNRFNEVELPLQLNGKETFTFHFSDIEVIGEKMAKKM